MNAWWNLCASLMLILVGLSGCAGKPQQQGVATPETQPGIGAGVARGAAAEKPGDSQAATLQRALSLMRNQQYAQAVTLLESLPRPSQQALLPMLNLAIAYSRLGKLAQAEETLRQVLQRDPANAIAYNELGIVERRAGRFRQAGEAYRRALQLRPAYALAHLNLGILCDLYLQDPACALSHYQAYQRLADGEGPPVELWIEDLSRRYPDRHRDRTGE